MKFEIMVRTDIHAPKNIDPTEYEYVGVEFAPRESENFLLEEARIRGYADSIKSHMDETGGVWASHRHGGSCMVCGAHALYTAVYRHRGTNEYIRTGFDCAAKMDMGNPSAFKMIKDEVSGIREARAGKMKAERILREKNAALAWDIYLDNRNTPDGGLPDVSLFISGEKFTTIDIVGKLVRYGDISDKAMDYLKRVSVWAGGGIGRKALETYAEELEGFLDPELGPEAFGVLADFMAESDNERFRRLSKYVRLLNGEKGERILNEITRVASAKDVPAGKKVDVEGVVISTKEVESMYGVSLKMLVESPDGWRVFGSVPNSVDINKGDTITFRASEIEKSKDDPKFGFFKRPTRAKVVQMGEVSEKRARIAAEREARWAAEDAEEQEINW